MDVDKIIWCLQNGKPETKKCLKKLLNDLNNIVDEEINDKQSNEESLLSDENVEDLGQPSFINQNKSSGGLRNFSSKINEGKMESEHVSQKTEKPSELVLDSFDLDDEEEQCPELRAPLNKGWKRETIIQRLTRKFEIIGDVSYYAPSSLHKLTDIKQVEKVLDQKNCDLTTNHFSFSTKPLIGTFIQYFDGKEYKRMTDVETAELLKTRELLKSRLDDKKVEKDTEKCENVITKTSTSKNHEYEENTSVIERDQFESFETASLSGSESENESGRSNDALSLDESESESTAFESDDSISVNGGEKSTQIKLKKYGGEERNFYDEKGYLYSLSNNSSATKSYYFRCKNKKKYDCNVTAISKNKDLNITVLKGEHTHAGSDSVVDTMKFCYNLDKEIKNNPLEFAREVYLNTMESMIEEIDVNNVPDKSELSSFIYRRKLQFVPKLPKSVDDFEEMINNENYKEKFTKDKWKKPFFRGVCKTSKGGSNIVFISETILKIVLLMSSIVFRMDGTFKMLPRHVQFRQLFIISVIYRDKSYPLAYILMETKKFEAYDDVFTMLKEFIPSHLVTEIMADYESATRKAVRKHFPKARLVGCWFHYIQAINRVAKRFGLLSEDGKFSDVVKYLSALALLPENYTAEGFDIIDESIKDSARWNRFSKYWNRQWKGANISVYGLVDRTNNQAESLNKSINVLIGARHPNIWKLLNRLILLDMDYSNQILKAKKGKLFREKINNRKQTKSHNKQIDDATSIFNRTKDVTRFLETVTYDLKVDVLLKERLNVNEMFEYEKNDYDEIIGNDFSPCTMRKRKLEPVKRSDEPPKSISKSRAQPPKANRKRN